jgi:hypothetical protein
MHARTSLAQDEYAKYYCFAVEAQNSHSDTYSRIMMEESWRWRGSRGFKPIIQSLM